MFLNLEIEQIRVICRRQLENFEFWARRFIHEQLSKKYGDNYFNYQYPDGNYLIKKSIQDSASKRMKSNTNRYTRPVDALLLEDIICILCNESLYKELFKKALDSAYPFGSNGMRFFLDMLIPVRNHLAHANPISIRQAEQVICYTNDFIDSIKLFYKKENLFMNYNVPQIIKIVDSFGDECYKESFESAGSVFVWNKKGKGNNYELRPGEIYKVEIEIDPTFDDDEYDIQWRVCGSTVSQLRDKKSIELEIKENHVNDSFVIDCIIISKKGWHKFGSYDDELLICLRVLPPI